MTDDRRPGSEDPDGRVLRAAARMRDEHLPALRLPDFDALLGDALPDRAPALRASPLRQAVDLLAAERRMLPRALPPAVAAGFALAVACGTAGDSGRGTALTFGILVVLVTIATGLMACAPRRDPRSELLRTLPVRPTSVFSARLALVLGLDLVGACVATLALSALGSGVDVLSAAQAWLGPAVLAAGLSLTVSLAVSPVAGAIAGYGAWAVAVAGLAMPSGPLGGLADAVWVTNAGTLVVGLLLLVLSVRVVTLRPVGP